MQKSIQIKIKLLYKKNNIFDSQSPCYIHLKNSGDFPLY
jgi:hypothetical protein